MAVVEKYPLEITAEAKGTTAVIRISGGLYQWNNSTEEFSQKIDALIEQGANDVEVYINSPGGDVFVAAEIINQINRFPGKKTGTGGAIVASAATSIAIELDSFEMAENGQWMYHKPMGSLYGNEDRIVSDLKLLQDLTTHYKSRYAAKTGKSIDEIEAAWGKGDVWLTASEAKKQKFITGVVSKVKITPETKALFEATGAPKIPKIDEFNPDLNMKNRNQIIAALKLPMDATDEQIQAAVEASAQAAGEASGLKDQAEKNQKNRIQAAIDAAILDKKVQADQRENLIEMGMAKEETLIKYLASLPAIAKPTNDPGQSNADIHANWTLADYLEKDPNALEVLAEKDPSKFQALNEAHYGIKI